MGRQRWDGGVRLEVDGQGHIVGWPPQAERWLGYPCEQVLGRPCHHVLDCRDAQGWPVGGLRCPILVCVRAGLPAPPMVGYVRHQDGRLIRVMRSGFAESAGGLASAAIYLEACSEQAVVVRQDGVGLDGVDLFHTLDRILERTGADAAEFFVAFPQERILLLAAHRGEASRAFLERVEFGFGTGFPGLTAETGEPLVTVDLAGDQRYLRRSVAQEGFRCYVCVPVVASRGLLGTLHVAARGSRVDLVARLPFLREVARCLGGELDGELNRFQRWLTRPSLAKGALSSIPSDPQGNLQSLVEHLTRGVAAASGLLLVADGESSPLPLAAFSPRADAPRSAAWGRAWARCPALRRRSPQVVRRRRDCPSGLCRAVHGGAAVRLCVPIVAGCSRLGLFSAGYPNRSPWPGCHLLRLVAGVQVLADALEKLLDARRPPGHPAEAAGAAAMPAGVGATAGQDEGLGPHFPPGFLHIRCLGRFSVSRDGIPITAGEFRRHRARVVLKILLSRYGRPVHRDELMEWLWSGNPPPNADQLLQGAVHYLRRALEPLSPQPGHSRFILTEGKTYLFNPQAPHWLDVREFSEKAARSQVLERRGERAAALALSCEAAGLYRGPFLEDEPYSEWCSREREQLRSTYLEVLRRIGRLRSGEGDYGGAIEAYRRALAVDPLLEDVHRSLMEVLWRAGRRSEALQQFQRCRSLLKSELGVAPGPQIEALYRSLLSGMEQPADAANLS